MGISQFGFRELRNSTVCLSASKHGPQEKESDKAQLALGSTRHSHRDKQGAPMRRLERL